MYPRDSRPHLGLCQAVLELVCSGWLKILAPGGAARSLSLSELLSFCVEWEYLRRWEAPLPNFLALDVDVFVCVWGGLG